MIVADTSVWIDHLRRHNVLLARRLEEGVIGVHPCVIGELACGGLKSRTQVLHFLASLPRVPAASFNEVIHFIESRKLMGRGIGWTDAQILAGCILGRARMWTLDNRLRQIAEELMVAVT